MNELKFNSQICTTIEQSKRLLALGIKRDTADMGLAGDIPIAIENWKTQDTTLINSPAWSLHRLIEMMPSFIDIGEHTYMFSIIQGKLFSYCSDIAGNALLYGKGSVYESAVYTIEWLIKEGYFNKEYLTQ